VVREQTGGVQETLASLAANTRHNFELTLLGDGLSSESLVEFKSLPQSSTETAFGTPACFNRLIRRTTSDFYLLLEAGTRVAPDWLDYLLAALERYPRCGLAGPSTNRAVNAQCVFPGAGDTPEEIERIAKLCVRRFGNTCRPMEPVHSLSDFCYLVRRDVIQAIGEADEAYDTGQFWEMDYNRRAASAGFQELWACAAYVHRAPATARITQEDIERTAANKQIYEKKFHTVPKNPPALDDHVRTTAVPDVSTATLTNNQQVIPQPRADQPRRITAPSPSTRNASLHRGLKELKDFQGIHSGETIVVCGCGVSVNLLENPRRFITIGVNDLGRSFHPDYLVVVNPRNQFQDDRFRYVEESQAQVIFTQLVLGLRHPHVVRFNLGKRAGTDFSANSLNYTSNSPYIALCLAVHMGAKRIGVIGVDFTNDHFFGQTGVHALTRQLPQIDREYQQLYAECLRRGVEVFNLSRESRLTAFPKMPLAEFEKTTIPVLAKAPAAEGLRIVSYSTMPVAGVPALLARCITARTAHECRSVWARNHYGNGVTFQGDIEWEKSPSVAADLLKSADLFIVHNGKVDPSHRPLLAGKPVITLAHNYMWNVDDSFVQQGFPGLVVGQYQATLPEFERWQAAPNPVPLWEEAFQPGPKHSQLTICYTPSGKHEVFPAGHRLYWHAKGYETTMRVLERLAQRFSIRLEVIRTGQVSHAESLAMKKRAHIVIDECVTGSYHRNSLEGLALACVVVNGLGRVPQITDVFRTCAGSDAQIPFVYAGLEELEGVLTSLVEQGPAALAAQGQQNRLWMEQHWDFQQQWRRFWQPVIDRGIGSLQPNETGNAIVNTMTVETPAAKCEPPTPLPPSPELRTGLSVVVCHGGEERLPLLSASLANLRQCSGMSEIIVVDMGTAPFAETIARRCADKYIFVHNDDVFERARSLNIGTALAEHDIILWTDNDLIFPSDFIARAVAEMRCRQLDYLIPFRAVNYLSESDSQRVMAGNANPADCTPAKSFRALYVTGGAGLVRKSFVLTYGGLSEAFRGWGGEDGAWWHKAKLLGQADVIQRRDQYVYHLYHPNSGANGGSQHRDRNPYYSDNLNTLKKMVAIRDRDSYLRLFPPQPLSSSVPEGATLESYAEIAVHSEVETNSNGVPQQHAAATLSDVTILITSFLRPGYLQECLAGIRRNLPECKVIVIDDSGDQQPGHCVGVHLVQLPFDSGLSAKRNAGVKACTTKYLLMGSDDFDFSTAEARAGIQKLVRVLEEHPDVDVAGGHHNNQRYEGFLEFVAGSHIKETRLFANQQATVPSLSQKHKVYKVDLIVNYFLARRESIRGIPWDERMKIGGEHGDWFLTLKETGKTVVWVDGVNINELPRDRNKEHPDYGRYRARAVSLGHRIFLEKRGIQYYFGFDDPVPAALKPRPKVLLAVITCKQYADRVAAQRETWIPKAIAAGYDVQIFDGERLGVPDDYYSLIQKTQALCKWALAQGYDRLLKVDDDCCIRVHQLGPNNFDYAGIVIASNDLGSTVPPCAPAKPKGTYPHHYASGGAYWLSHRAMTIVAHAQPNGDWAEDRFVGDTLARHGIFVQRLPDFTWPVSGRMPRHWTVLTQLPTPAHMRDALFGTDAGTSNRDTPCKMKK
jgi:GT2 family glycosyltransferase